MWRDSIVVDVTFTHSHYVENKKQIINVSCMQNNNARKRGRMMWVRIWVIIAIHLFINVWTSGCCKLWIMIKNIILIHLYKILPIHIMFSTKHDQTKITNQTHFSVSIHSKNLAPLHLMEWDIILYNYISHYCIQRKTFKWKQQHNTNFISG